MRNHLPIKYLGEPMNKKIFNLLLITCFALLSTGCHKEDLNDTELESPYRLNVNFEYLQEWEFNSEYNWNENWQEVDIQNSYDSYRPNKPEGIAVILFNEHNGNYTFARELHISANGGDFSVDASTRAILFMNDDSDYIIINNLGTPQTTIASTGNHMNTTFNDFHRGERSVKQPDFFYSAFVEITEDQIKQGNVQNNIVLSPQVYSYIIKYPILKNCEYVVSVSGAFAGMASNVNVKDGSTTTETKARYIFDSELTNYGVIAKVNTFGVPALEGNINSKASSEYKGQYDIRMELKLSNGKKVTFDYDVTEQVSQQPRGGVIIIPGVEISDDLVKDGSGFQPDIDDWGDNTDIPLPL